MRPDISDLFPIVVKGSENKSFPWNNVFTESNAPDGGKDNCLTLSFDDSNHLVITYRNECEGNITFGDEDKSILTEQMIKILHGELLVDCDYSDMKDYLLPKCFFYTISADPENVTEALRKLPIEQPDTKKIFIFINGSIDRFGKIEGIIDDIRSYFGAEDIAFAFDGNQQDADKNIRVNLWIPA